MAKNLKINIKNSQLAEALKIDKQKKKPAPPKAKAAEKVEEVTHEEVAPPTAAAEVVMEAKEKQVEPVKTKEPSFAEEATQLAKKEENIPEAKLKQEPKSSESPSIKEGVEPSAPQKPRAPQTPSSYQPRPQSSGPRPAFTPHSQRSYDRPRGEYTPRPQYGNQERGAYQQRPYEQRGAAPSQGGYQRRPYEGKPSGEFQEGGYRPQQRPPYSPRPYPPRPPRDQQGVTPVIPPKEFAKGDKEGIKTAPVKKAFKSTVLEDEDSTKKASPQHKDFRDVGGAKKTKDQYKSFDSRDRQGLRDNESGEEWRKRRAYKPKVVIQEDVTVRPKKLNVRIPITVKDLAAAMKLKASQLISKLFMQGVIITLNDFLDDETTIQLLGHEFECEIGIDTSEEDKIKITDKTIKEEIVETEASLLKIRPPVIAFMGHVDHGKTSLIDAIRTSNIAAGEAGAITQHIGAFQCHTAVGTITILDTPGHEAFSEMRSRGADVTDIVVLVIAGDEGIKTQTLEALHQAEEAKVTVVVAINKCDKPTFNAENVYRQLADNNHLPEAWGGTTITVNCSATTKQGIPELLEMLALQAEVLELKANPESRARGTVIESEMHKGLGAVTTVLVQNGTLRLGDALVVGEYFARVKTMYNENGKQLIEAGPSAPVKVTGLSGLPLAGSEFIVVKNEKEAKELSEKRSEGQRLLQLQTKKASIENFLQKKAEGIEKKFLPLILKADVQGSLEALKNSLLKIPSQKVELNIIHASVGEISESDIELAAASKAAIVGFHTGIESHAESLIKQTKVSVVLNDIIYHIVDDVKKIMLAQLDKIAEERDAGSAEVKMVFRSSHIGNIAGCIVTDGTIKRNQHIRVMRSGKMIWKGPIASLKRVKEDVKEVGKGIECGIVLQGFHDFMPEDILQAYDIIYLEQQL